MAWIYLQESEASQLPLKTGSDQSPTVKSTNTAKVSSCRECRKGTCPKHQFGTMYEHYPLKNYLESTSSPLGFLVKISQLPGLVKAWKESEAVFFSRSCDLSGKLNLLSFFSKMSPPYEHEDWIRFSQNLPKNGMIVGGLCFRLLPWEPDIEESDGSSWATPNTMDHLPLRSKEALDRQFATTRKGRTKPANLREQIHPECWPTPSARNPPDCRAERKRKSPQLESVANISQSTNGKMLSPMFVELLMGYPIDWTELKPLETQ